MKMEAEKTPRFGNQDESAISTTYAQCLSLTFRLHVRRYTWLTNTHSKATRQHAAMTALFVRPNMALVKKTTPAMNGADG